MKRMNKLIALLLTLVMALALTACGGAQQPAEAPAAENAGGEPAPAAENAGGELAGGEEGVHERSVERHAHELAFARHGSSHHRRIFSPSPA